MGRRPEPTRLCQRHIDWLDADVPFHSFALTGATDLSADRNPPELHQRESSPRLSELYGLCFIQTDLVAHRSATDLSAYYICADGSGSLTDLVT